MNKEEKREYLHELIDKLNDEQISKLIELIRGIFGKIT